MKTLRIFTLFFASGFFFSGCVSDKLEVEEIPFEYYTQDELKLLQSKMNISEVPEDYISMVNSNASVNSPSNRKGILGRALFYDKNLSSDNSVSCASCHDQSKGFADDKAFSDGPENRKTTRNTLGLGVVRTFQHYYGTGGSSARFFWDERAQTLTDQTEETIQNPDEMGLKMDEVLEYVKNQQEYQILHKYAFPNRGMAKEHILDAIGVFINSISSSDSKFDLALNNSGSINSDMQGFTNVENIGREIFATNCNTCHGFSVAGAGFFGSSGFTTVANNGLEMDYEDLGVASFTGLKKDEGVFKVPGLRNVALTAPYMHDGRFATLEEVIDFYNNGIVQHPNLHDNLKTSSGLPKKLNITDSEKAALIAFLNTLTDDKMAQDVRWSDPFIN